MMTMPEEPKKQIEQLTDEELIEAYKKGERWLANKQQVTGSAKNQLGQMYKHSEWEVGLKRLEKIETEVKKRGLAL